MQSNALFPMKHVRSLDLLDGTTESPQEIPHKSRRTMLSSQESEIARCSPHQLQIMTNSPRLASEQSLFPHHTGKVAWLLLGNDRDSLRHTSQVYRNTITSTGTPGKLHVPHIVLRRELIPRILSKRYANFPQAPQEEPSFRNWYGEGP